MSKAVLNRRKPEYLTEQRKQILIKMGIAVLVIITLYAFSTLQDPIIYNLVG